MDLTGWTLQEIAGKTDYEGGPAEMIGWGGFGSGETVGPLNEIAPGLGDAWAKLREGLEEVERILPEPEYE